MPTRSVAREAEAHYRVVDQFDWQALVEVSLVTGKRNQIRAQAGSRGHALVGERQYRFGRPRDEAHEPEFGRQALHAARLAFTHPVTRRRVEFTAALPDDMKRLLQTLRGTHAGQPQRTQRPQRPHAEGFDRAAGAPGGRPRAARSERSAGSAARGLAVRAPGPASKPERVTRAAFRTSVLSVSSVVEIRGGVRAGRRSVYTVGPGAR